MKVRPDHIVHILVSWWLAGFLLAALQYLSAGWIVAALLALAVGVGKEVYDIRRSGFDWGDVKADCVGIGIALLLWGVGLANSLLWAKE